MWTKFLIPLSEKTDGKGEQRKKHKSGYLNKGLCLGGRWSKYLIIYDIIINPAFFVYKEGWIFLKNGKRNEL
jgi:hypothetical protein